MVQFTPFQQSSLFNTIALYFDPGLGAMLIQGLVAAAAGFLLFSKGILFKIKSFFGLTSNEEDDFESIDIDDKDSGSNG